MILQMSCLSLASLPRARDFVRRVTTHVSKCLIGLVRGEASAFISDVRCIIGTSNMPRVYGALIGVFTNAHREFHLDLGTRRCWLNVFMPKSHKP